MVGEERNAETEPGQVAIVLNETVSHWLAVARKSLC